MSYAFSNNKLFLAFTLLCYTLFFWGFVYSIRGLSSISTALILGTGLLSNPGKRLVELKGTPELLFVTSLFLFFLLQLVAMAYTNNFQEGWKNIALKSGLVFIPLSVLLTAPLAIALQKKLFRIFCIILVSACVYCLVEATRNYFHDRQVAVFFYHALGAPVQQHAVYFSVYVFAALVLLMESQKYNKLLFGRAVDIVLILFLSFFLVLLASRFVITSFAVYVFIYFFSFSKNKRQVTGIKAGSFILILAIGSTLFFTNNEVSRRYKDFFNGSISVVQQDKFKPSDYFNGIQFRLIQWKLVFEILNENKAWWKGMTAGDAQTYLNHKYVEKGIYTGDPIRGDTGFLNYNTHNQLLESLLQNGMPGLLTYLFILFGVLKIAAKNKNRSQVVVIATLVGYSFIESVFEVQYGILFFCFLPLFVKREVIATVHDRVLKQKKSAALAGAAI